MKNVSGNSTTENNEEDNDDPSIFSTEKEIDNEKITDYPAKKTLPKTGNRKLQNAPQQIIHKRKWVERLREFFMLFFAVFLSFMVENFRIAHVNKGTEKGYMVSMLRDLNDDTLSTNSTIKSYQSYITGQDSALNYLSGNLNNQDTAEMALIYFHKYGGGSNPIKVSDGTISQLKNNGGLRLLKNQEVINKINTYYNEIGNVREQENFMNEYLILINKQRGEIFNYSANRHFVDSVNRIRNMSQFPVSILRGLLTHQKPTMLTTDMKMLSPFMSNISFQIGLMDSYIVLVEKQKRLAIELMQAIKKEYHLENE